MVTRIAVMALGLVASATSVAHAQIDNAGVLDQALKRFRDAAQGWQDAAHGSALSLFWSLATMSLVWTIGQLALRRAELGEFFGELVRYLLFTGFWAWMLQNGPQHAQMIIDSMVRIGGSATGSSLKSPSGVLDVGFQLLDRALEQSSLQSPIETSIGVVMALGVLIILALVGVNMLVAMISCWIVAYGGLIVLGFGGSKWTSDMAMNYYRMILSLGLQVLAMILIVGAGEGMLRDYFGRLEQTVNVRELAVMLVVALVLLNAVTRVPALIGTLANGSSPQYAMGSGAGGGAAWSAMSTAGAVAAMASGGATSAYQQLMRAASTDMDPGASGALADSFRPLSSEQSASSGSVFAPPPTGGATAAALGSSALGREAMVAAAGTQSAGQARDASSAPGSSDSAHAENAGSSDEGASPNANADGASRADTASTSARDADTARSEVAAAGQPESALGSRSDAPGSSGATGGDPEAARGHSAGRGAPAAPNPSAAAQSAASSSTRGLWSASAPVSERDGGGRAEASPNISNPRAHEAIAGASSSGAPSGSPSSSLTQASSLSASASAGGSAMHAPSSALLSAAAQPVSMPPSDGLQLLSPPAPLGAFLSTPHGGASPLLPTHPNAVASSSRELLAATQGQTAVDIEAEVAAFRDQES